MKTPVVHRCLYVQLPGAKLGFMDGKWIVSLKSETIQTVPAGSVRRICILGNAQITSTVIAQCVRNKIPLHVLSQSGKYTGSFSGSGYSLTSARKRQYQLQDDSNARLNFARSVVSGKIHNEITFLNQTLRNHPEKKELLPRIFQLKNLSKRLVGADSLDEISGVEGLTARIFFAAWGKALRKGDFSFSKRIHRQAPDPINSMLSMGYSLLTSRIEAGLQIRGLDSSIGMIHASRAYPALACDLIEEFRTPIVDALVFKAVNMRQFRPVDFELSPGPRPVCSFTNEARKRFLTLFEEKLLSKRKTPDAAYPVSWSDIIDLQILNYKRFAFGKTSEYVPYKYI